MSTDLSGLIEQFLLDRGTWVSALEICERFGVRERALRQLNDRPGLCTAYAISSSKKGLKHIDLATTSEWLEFKHALRKHGISELVRVRALDRRRAQVIKSTQRPPIRYEKDTKQLVMVMVMI